MENFISRLKNIKVILFDIDGVLTNNSLIMHPSGEFLRNMNSKDGLAISKAIEEGFILGIISGGESASMRKRLEYLKFSIISTSINDKLIEYNRLKELYGFIDNEVAYMGDDIPDIELLKTVSISSCPKDSANEVLRICDYISSFKGGKGAARDLLERILKSQDKWYKI